MHKSMILLILFSLISVHALGDESIKQKIQAYELEIPSASKDQKSPLLLKLAQAYLKDQEEEKAIKTFLKAVELSLLQSISPEASTEKENFEKGMKIYLSTESPHSPKEAAYKLLQEFEQIHKKHPEYYTLNLLISTAYANLGRYDDFFEVYFNSYPYVSNHYLSYKIKAILHVKLFEKGKMAEEREFHKKMAFDSIKQAIERYPQDMSLYKMAVLLSSSPLQKAQAVNESLNEIISRNIIIPRHDIIFFVREAIETHQKDIAQKFVDKCREWYQYSRTVNEVQEYIDRKKNNE
jgi:tetratricopeptide (TPR) repeat protein